MRTSKLFSLLFHAAAFAFTAYMIWGAVAYTGLYRSVQDWEVARFGSTVPGLAAIGPITVIAVPLWFFGMMADGSLDPSTPKAAPSRAKGLGCMGFIALVGVVLLIAGIGALVRAAHRPTLDDPVQQVDLAKLGTAPPPIGHVQLLGIADNARTLAIVREGRRGSSEDSFTPVVAPGGAGASQPLRFFLSGHRLDPAGPPPTMSDDPEGLLTADALPGDARSAFERQGVRIADPAYVLDRSGIDARFDDWVTGGLCILGGLGCLAMLMVGRKSPAREGTPA
ncbi:hypothetical protein BH10PSE13_BH10PSE13_19180 [soil metagenome]